MNTYKILEDNKEDPTAIRVEKGGITCEFTVADLMNEQQTFRKYIRQGEGQLRVEENIMANVMEHHPALAALSAEDLFAAGMYQSSFGKASKLRESIENIETELHESEKTMNEMVDALGITLPTPQEVVDAAVEKVVGPEEETETEHAG